VASPPKIPVAFLGPPEPKGTPQPASPGNPQPSLIQTSPNLVAFDPKAVVPSQTIYVQRNDFIGFLFLANTVGTTVRVNYRWLTPQGEIKEGELDTPAFSTSLFQNFPLYEGWLLSFSARIVGGTPGITWCFAQAIVTRSGLAAASNLAHAIVWQGYLYFNASNGWPGTPAKEITDGAAILRSITGTAPVAGAEISETVPANRRWNLLAFRATLTTAIAVANRVPTLRLDDGVNIFFVIQSLAVQAASLTDSYNFAPGNAQSAAIQTDVANPIPNPTYLKAGSRIRTLTGNIQAADQWSAPQYLVQEWGNWDL
jgi:hypothetical protein